MKIAVIVREVSVVPDKFEITGNKIEEKYVEHELNEWDNYAVEEAVQISEQQEGTEVVVITIGPERTEEIIRTCLAKGADRGIRIWDETLAEMDFIDVDARTKILSAGLAAEDPDLILTGAQTGDEELGAVGVHLATRLNYGWAAIVNQTLLDEDQIRVHRELEGGMIEKTDIDLPAVLTIQTGINEPRYASIRGIRAAQRKTLDLKSLDDLGINGKELGSCIEIKDVYIPEVDEKATLWSGDPEETAEQLSDYLVENEVVST
ncbi:electron transfer flavoprotein subunit beta/FixA family protein [Salinarchaeum sp. IM2453]|uniref:electron transfer flavoprotein subunit beta/FixA family protein n=1 Tax=Salinarchaeum sp. IM2453 TaxID=2862870 RepID=UPI001C82DB8B|nr:electron transfer flavoprotein subunit beta/FixA family protein [Salinarchaeum sp. IM2453]QZA89582.1 electron transfer flavoprotein subunit beta/FixA family protein [Salinarchaeum sp. IM2453]